MLVDYIKNKFIEKSFFNINNITNEIDGINGKIAIKKDSSIEEKLKAINLCVLVGFYSTAIDLPIIKIINNYEEIGKNDIDINNFDIFINDMNQLNNNQNDNKQNNKMKIFSDLTNLNNGLLIDTDNDYLPDEINCQIIINKNSSNNELISACNIATALGLNSLGCNTSIAKEYDDIIQTSNKVKIYIGNEIYKSNKKLLGDNKEKNIIFDKNYNAIFICEKDDKIISVSEFFSKNMNYLVKKNETSLNDFENYLKTILNNKPKSNGKIVFEKEYNFEWEVDNVKSILEKEVIPNLTSNDEVEISIVVSEEKEVRDKLKEYINSNLNSKHINVTKCSVLCAYKQGLSWIMEEVIEEIKTTIDQDNIGSIDIKFKPFLPYGKTKWCDEDGATPNINASRVDSPDKYFDLPIRLVQELYPVDDLIEKEINISREKVEFKIQEECNYDYEFILYDNENNILLLKTFNVHYSERPYLNEFEGIGKVHPNTGYVEVKVNGSIVLSKSVKTDVERIWDVYQNEVLQECKNYILKKTNNNPTADKQPFFDVLKLDILTSEPDYKLDVRQDIISVLSALHEDLYFVGLDFFKTLGIRNSNEPLDEPGLILPIISKRNAQGTYMKVSLETFDRSYDQNLDIDLKINQLYVYDKEISKIYVDICSSKESFELIKTKQELLETYISKENYGFKNLVFRYEDEVIIIENKKQDTSKTDEYIDISSIQIPQDRVIGYDEYVDIIEKLKKVNGLSIFKASQSYQGRDIYAIEILKQYKSSLVSRTKLINNKPVLQINNRHHANEVSSTNSAFLLINQLLTNESYNKYLDKVNVVMIPFENVDGGYIHYELQKDNPEWQFHIARFNSVGKEFCRDYFNGDSKYTESMALPKLWHKWLPDILTDNHGVPKHEWDQQFSGYTSPWFKGFWLPRALFYGYFWYIEDEKYPENKIISEALQDVVSDYVNGDNEIKGWNNDWKNRFEKYAHQWMPKLFPANYYKDLIYYWIKGEVDESAWHVSHRYPWITAVDWTTEVSDETAQGKYLELCSRTHYLGDIATIDLLSKSKFDRNKYVKKCEDEIILKDIRIRPIKL